MARVTRTDLHCAGERGLANPLGHNNCFLNSILQIFFHFEDFREAVIDEGSHLNEMLVEPPEPGEYNKVNPATAQQGVVMQLGYLFSKFKMERKELLTPRDVRDKLTKLIPSFATGSLEDAHECYEVVLNTLDSVCGTKRKSKTAGEPGIPSGIAHDFFGIHTQHKAECTCGNTKRVIYSDECFYRTLIASKLITDGGDMAFERLVGQQEMPLTCDHCKAKVKMKTTLRSLPPRILTVNVNWSKETCPRDDLRKFMASIPIKWRVQDSLPSKAENRYVAVLQGIVFYYGCHYISTYYNKKLSVWVIFDDSNIRAAAKTIPGLWQYAVDGKLMPFMLFYQVGAMKDESIKAATACFDFKISSEPSVVKHEREAMLEWLREHTRKDVEEEEGEEGGKDHTPEGKGISLGRELIEVDVDAEEITPEAKLSGMTPEAKLSYISSDSSLFNWNHSYVSFDDVETAFATPVKTTPLFKRPDRKFRPASAPIPPLTALEQLHKSLYFATLTSDELEAAANHFETALPHMVDDVFSKK
eukprot:TRINITY_DN1890_c1_g1_i3.p1 TRINITY_DN1890_c1_g1~~TRINITY_DN1890_c1_g1_i3.p1  ORF type:complete len:530 (+),score=90.35 TRINITY_DN1890_c1_g1_i3:30-1619(+)